MSQKAHGARSNKIYNNQLQVSFLVFTYLCFRLANMFLLKEELTVEVADINCVQVNLPKALGIH